MTARLTMALLACLLLFGASDAQEDFRRADRPWNWSFPRDHGSHPGFQTEWWYFTSVLQDESGRQFGMEATFFRFALRQRLPERAAPWRARDLILSHFTVTDVANGRFHLSEGVQRSAAGLAGADSESLHVWMGKWHIRQAGAAFDLQAGDGTDASEDGIGASLRLLPQHRPILHGDEGLSWKSDDRHHASYYYSMPRLRTTGSLWIAAEEHRVSGTTWMDHEFFTGATPLQGVGWDWFSCRLDDGRDLMLYLLRYPDGSRFRSGTLMQPDGTSRPLRVDDMLVQPLRTWTSSRTQATYPVQWRLSLPAEHIQLEVEAQLEDQEVHATQTVGFAYWEGLCRVGGSVGGVAVRGDAYVELTGYAPADR